MNFTARLKRLTKHIHTANPHMGWRECSQTARADLYGRRVYPEYSAVVREYEWKSRNVMRKSQQEGPLVLDADEEPGEQTPDSP